MVLKTTKKRLLCGLSHNPKTTGTISIKFYITGPPPPFSTAAQHRPWTPHSWVNRSHTTTHHSQ